MPLTGRELRAERRLADITQVDLAARMGVSRMTVWSIESGRVVLTPDRIRAYHAALHDAIVAAKERVA
jgi:transcriptional regulator with XRE-family HTH domain